MRPWVQKQDKAIIALWFEGTAPKVIAVQLNVTIHIVYEALRRGRIAGSVPRRTKNLQENTQDKIEQPR